MLGHLMVIFLQPTRINTQHLIIVVYIHMYKEWGNRMEFGIYGGLFELSAVPANYTLYWCV